MDPIFTISVIVLLVLAVSGLVVGVSNDAINFLNSAIGSKVAPRRVIMAIASAGLIIGALTSSGMMEVARSGVFHPEMFNFRDVTMLFLGVMFANVILLDIFNTAGLPTSTTVSLVFGLLGSAIAVAMVKIWGGEATGQLGQYINSGNALKILSGILVSVVIAFFFGTLIMWISRLIFTFRYHRLFVGFGALWCGVAMSAIVYFALFKGLKSTGLISPEALEWIGANTGLFLLGTWIASSAVLALLQHLVRVNILKITILAGTFSLALAFAGNDLVNFIGVPMAGYDSYRIAASTGDVSMMMGQLSQPVSTNFLFLSIAGLIMVVTLWTSKKAQSVSETEINLAKQDAGAERFGSTLMSRALVRTALNINRSVAAITPSGMQRAINKRFIPLRLEEKEQAPFDMIRATVNLMVASLLITMGTSLKLPLSTTYVTFMVAMGTSLADRAWGRESAVYRITGVLTVISGWFITALIAFVLAFGISLGLMYGGSVAVIGMTLLAVFLIVQSSLLHDRRRKRREVVVEHQAGFSLEDSPQEIITKCVEVVRDTMHRVTDLYEQTLRGVAAENRRSLRAAVREADELYAEAHDRKYHLVPTLQSLDNYAYAGHYYVQVVDYISEMTKALVHITRPCYEHIDNNHEGLSKDQVEDLQRIGVQVSAIFDRVNEMLRDGDFDHLDEILDLRDRLFEVIAEAMTRQLRRIKHHSTSTKTSMLYLTILNETKNMVLQSRNLVKSQKYFIENCEDIDELRIES